MSIVGIDYGNSSCYIAVVRDRKINVIDNEFSLRSTPAFVAFGDQQRLLGVAAKKQAVTNPKNTVFNFKRFLGRSFDDPSVQEDSSKVPYQLTKTESGGIGIKVNYLGQDQVYSPEQVTAMLFTKLKETAENGIQAKVHDCVISVPSYFTDAERRGLLDAAEIAGFNVRRLLSETLAAAINYAFTKRNLPDPEEKPRNVVIVDCGHSSLQVSITAFNKGKLKILASTSDPYLGGRNFDAALANHFCVEFRSKYNMDPETNAEAYMRLITEVEKVKKQLSTKATKLPLNIESLMDEQDVSSSISRSEFEELCASLFQRFEDVLQKCLDDSKIDLGDIHSVEIVGGSSRIPAIKSVIKKVYGKAPCGSLNQDEAVSRGCALLCQFMSPESKFRDCTFFDVQHYPIKLIWDESAGENGATEVFPRYHPVPSTRMVTLHCKDPVTLHAVYTGQVPYPTNSIGKFTINVKTEETEPVNLVVEARVNLHGIFSITRASIYEKLENGENKAEEAMETENTDSVPTGMDVNMEKVEKKKTKKVQYKAKDIDINSLTFGLTRTELDEKIMSEVSMIRRDKNERDRQGSKNALEDYLKNLREKLDVELNSFVEDTEREQLSETLTSLENWLYKGGEYEKKEVYLQKLEELQTRVERTETTNPPPTENITEISENPGFKSLSVRRRDASRLSRFYDATIGRLCGGKETLVNSGMVKSEENALTIIREEYFLGCVNPDDGFLKNHLVPEEITKIITSPKYLQDWIKIVKKIRVEENKEKDFREFALAERLRKSVRRVQNVSKLEAMEKMEVDILPKCTRENAIADDIRNETILLFDVNERFKGFTPPEYPIIWSDEDMDYSFGKIAILRSWNAKLEILSNLRKRYKITIKDKVVIDV